MEFKFNDDGMEELRKRITKQYEGITVPLDGTHAKAVASVKQQLRARGGVPDNDEVERRVRRARG